MEKVIDLLKTEREQTKRSIQFFKEEIEHSKKANEELQSPEFIEKHKNSNNWSNDWTIQQFIDLNVSSNNRAIVSYSEKLEEANDYLRQIERALTVLNETEAVDVIEFFRSRSSDWVPILFEEHFYRLCKKYADAVKELEGRR